VFTLRHTPLGVSPILSCSSLHNSTCATSSSESRLSRVAVAAVTHVPLTKPDSLCKALIYTRHTLKSIVQNITNHPAANPNTVILNINDNDLITLQIINIYHAVPPQGHDLDNILKHKISNNHLTLLIGDFNTHLPRWSLPGKTPSSWASHLLNWMDDNGVECLNPLD
jgi:hypothetical protein